MKKITLFASFLLMLVMWNTATAQISLTAPNVPVLTDFTGFQANGCSPTPAAGQLDSKIFAIYGFTGGAGPTSFLDSLTFNDTAFVGDLARGVVTSFVPTVGGLYALDQGGDISLWTQPTGSDFTPGEIVMRIQNNAGVPMTQLDVNFDWKYGNDGNRTQSLRFFYSTDSVNFTEVTSLADTTIAARDSMYYTVNQATSITGLGVAAGDFIYIKWKTDDRGGLGQRDEIGLDNILVAMQTGTVTANVMFDATTATVAETAGSVTLTLTQSTPVACDVEVITTDLTATDGSDYTGGIQLINFDGITPSATVTFTILNDALVESPETFKAALITPSAGCMIAMPDTSIVTITDDDTPIPATVAFDAATATVNEGAGTIDVTLSQSNLRTCTIDVNVIGGGATAGADYTFTSPTTVTFDSVNLTQTLSIPIIDDALFELPEFFTLQISNPSAACLLGTPDTTHVTIISNDAPAMHDIGPLTTVDATGTPDSINVYCRVKGVAYGINYSALANGYQFGLADATGTIWVIRSNINLNYTVTEGDSIMLDGRVLLQNGMTRFRPDSIMLVNQGNPIPAVVGVTSAFTETNEADIVKLNMVKLVNPAQWTNAGQGFNVDVTDNLTTWQVRIDNDCDLFGQPAPTCSWFNVTGLLGQFDNTNPFTTGYQMFPRYTADLECLPNPQVSFVSAASSVAETAGTVNIDVTINNPNPDASTVTVAFSGTATDGADYTQTISNTLSFPFGITTLSIPINVLTDALVEGDETVVLTLSSPTNADLGAIATYTLTITDVVSIAPALNNQAVSLYPNPSANNFVIRTSEKVNKVMMYNNLGQCVKTVEGNATTINTENLTNGIYNVVITTDNGVWSGKWLKN